MIENISKDFKINIFFSEAGEELEELVANFLTNSLKERRIMVWIQMIFSAWEEGNDAWKNN